MKKLMLFLLIMPMSSLVLAWPWSDPVDELEEAWYQVSCCVNKALQSNPHQVNTENCGKRPSSDIDILTCIALGKKLKQAHRDRLAVEFCGEVAITANVKLEECKKKYKGNTCLEARKVGKARAFRECPSN
ncbi:hypothetical protein [Chromatium okenii]|jgi:hypothetical protein|uniref:hypothetical protein n=1 Tax=Chromatium okenii TaxID=61644 RepID=UPI0026E9763C|nr:hypothetical protein [Chromatium okenii]MBV5309752.1 hypothetical protein [Chromatium okenii]